MRRDGHAALLVNRGNGFRSREPPVDRSCDTGGDHVKPRRRQLLPGNDQRALFRAIETCSQPREPRRQQLVVVGDDDDVKPAAAGLASELPRRHAAVADEGVDMEVGGEHELIAGPGRAAEGHAIEHRARDYPTANQQQPERPREGHATSAPMIRTDRRVASSI